MKISPHFSRSEFACKCGCGFDTVDAVLLEILEDIRFHFNSPVTINSAARCFTHNSKVGGAMPSNVSKGSQHLYGRAADIVVTDAHPEDVYNYVNLKYDHGGFGVYDTFVHVDSRETKARWDKRTK